MADVTVPALPELTTPPDSGDWLLIVDVSTGITKKILVSTFYFSPTLHQLLVNNGITVANGGASITGSVSVFGGLTGQAATFSGGVAVTGDTPAMPGTIVAQPGSGLLLTALTGSVTDFRVVTPGLDTIMQVPTGTDRMQFPGGVELGKSRNTPATNTTVPITVFTTVFAADVVGPMITTIMGTDGTNEFVDQVAWSSSPGGHASVMYNVDVRGSTGGRAYQAIGIALQLEISAGGPYTVTAWTEEAI